MLLLLLTFSILGTLDGVLLIITEAAFVDSYFFCVESGFLTTVADVLDVCLKFEKYLSLSISIFSSKSILLIVNSFIISLSSGFFIKSILVFKSFFIYSFSKHLIISDLSLYLQFECYINFICSFSIYKFLKILCIKMHISKM